MKILLILTLIFIQGLAFSITYNGIDCQSTYLIIEPYNKPPDPYLTNNIFKFILKDSGYKGGNIKFYANAYCPNFWAISKPIIDKQSNVISFERYILYNPQYLSNLVFSSNSKPIYIFGILSHELAHHYYNHTDKLIYSNKVDISSEEQADYFSGKRIAQFGFKEKDLNDYIHFINKMSKNILTTILRDYYINKGYNEQIKSKNNNKL